jgi:Putative prokaryotic signal transducing protein
VKELLRSNDPVLLSWIEALLADSRIATVLLDVHTSIIEGSISAIPRRLMVGDDDYSTARRLLADSDHRLLSDDT